ncbi:MULTISPECIES: tetratricopeptide repeat protein [Spirulina sp. CCY15215]|uniref:tetratricopeptide repeat protein n=1 Tax=Spirulina sp. CCY15215 TaxID=2767591 RepID=UPI00194FC472
MSSSNLYTQQLGVRLVKFPWYLFGLFATICVALPVEAAQLWEDADRDRLILAQSLAQSIDNLNEQLQIPPLHLRPGNTQRGSDRNEGDLLLRLGGQSYEKGEFDKAIAQWLQALDFYERVGDTEAIGTTYDYLGVTFAKAGYYAEAENVLRRRLAIARDLQDVRGQIHGLNNLGTILLTNSNPLGAEASFAEALELSRYISYQEGEGLSLSNLGLASAYLGRYEAAIKYYKRANIFRRRFRDFAGQANTFNNLGNAYAAMGQHDLAVAEYRLARWYSREGRDMENLFRALRGLAISYGKINEFSAAFQSLDWWIDLARNEKNLAQELAGLSLYARYHSALGRREMAVILYENAIAIAQKLNDEQSRGQLMNELSQVIYDFPFGRPRSPY